MLLEHAFPVLTVQQSKETSNPNLVNKNSLECSYFFGRSRLLCQYQRMNLHKKPVVRTVSEGDFMDFTVPLFECAKERSKVQSEYS